MPDGSDEITARLHLSAILPLLEELAPGDREARLAVEGVAGVIQFSAPGGLAAQIQIDRGTVQVTAGVRKKADVSIYFPSFRFLNNLFRKEGLPVMLPVWGVWRVRLIRSFMKLSDRLAHYMVPSAAAPPASHERKLAAALLMQAALTGAAQVGQHDGTLRRLASSIPDGTAHIEIKNGPSVYLAKHGSEFTAGKGKPVHANVYLGFKDADTAYAMFTGKLDFMAAIPLGDIELDGSLVMLDKLTRLMERAEEYLA